GGHIRDLGYRPNVADAQSRVQPFGLVRQPGVKLEVREDRGAADRPPRQPEQAVACEEQRRRESLSGRMSAPAIEAKQKKALQIAQQFDEPVTAYLLYNGSAT